MSKHVPARNVDVALLMIRAMVGIVFVFHGSQKLFGVFDGPGLEGFAGMLESQLHVPAPKVSAILAACAEFFGGLSMLTGLGMRIVLIPTAITMLVAAFHAHGHAFALSKGGMEYALTLAVISIALIVSGPGRFSWSPTLRRVVGSKDAPVAVDD